MTTQRWNVRRIRLNSQGYDSGGSYWGTGIPLWYVYSADGRYDFYCRGTRDWATHCYKIARRQPDIQRACDQINRTGEMGSK